MSVLTGKHVLVVGDENKQIHDIENSLRGYGVQIIVATCAEVSPDKLKDLSIDLILLNHQHEEESCVAMLNELRNIDLNKMLPIFILVEDANDKIQDALYLGAADYITPKEPVDSIVQKIKTVFGVGKTFSSSSAIDITPQEADVTSTGIRVFVVEDDPLLRNLLSIRLDKSSFPSEFSSNGNEVLSKVRKFQPDIVILDLMLPGKDGFEILSELKNDDHIKDIPVIVFSNKDGQDDKNRAKELGASAFYVKAMTDLSELIEQIELLTK